MVKASKDVEKVLLIDSSWFNIPLAKAIKEVYPNKKIIYYILPQVWAWRRGRVKILEKVIDKLCSIIPFEKRFYSKNANIEYVGHPLLDEIKFFKSSISKSNIIAFLPGSRVAEIKALMPIFREISKRINKKRVLVVPSHFKNHLEIYGDISNFELSFNSQETLKEAEFAFICSGTATLEASLIGTPFILLYKAKWIDYLIAKSLVKLNYIGLANIFLNKRIHPEFIQNLNIDKILEAYYHYNYEIFFDGVSSLRDYLKHGSTKRVCEILNE